MLPNEVKARIEAGVQSAQAFVHEFSGGTDHYKVTVISPAFEGLMLIRRHRLVMDLFQEEIKSGEVHALSIETYTPAESMKKG